MFGCMNKNYVKPINNYSNFNQNTNKSSSAWLNNISQKWNKSQDNGKVD